MNAKDLKQFRSKLLAMRSELLEIEKSTVDNAKPVELDQTSVGRLSRMDAMQSQEMAQEMARRRQQQLVKVEGALRRVDTGEYGVCFRCGEEIDSRRLSADPTITRCIGCAEAN